MTRLEVVQGGATATRVPPQNLDAESSVLAACIDDPERTSLDAVRPLLERGDFYADANRYIWDTILALDAENQPVDVVTVTQRLRAEKRYEQVGGSTYLAQIAQATPAVANLEAHARIIAEKARQRRMVALGQRIVAEGYTELPDARTWALDAAQAATDIAAEGASDEDPAERFDELVPKVFEEMREHARHGRSPTAVPTGFIRLDEYFAGGWERSEMHVLGGRPGMGKTSAVLCACMNVAKHGEGVIFLSAEMPRKQLVRRALAVEAHVDVQAVMSGRMNAQEWSAVAAAAGRLVGLPLVIKECPGAKIGELRATIRKESRRLPPLGLAAVDYIQILDGERRDGDSREAEVSMLSRRLKWMAQEFRVPLLVVSQLNRSVEARANVNKRPTLSDLRESGAIEQDAYTVNLLYRDEYYKKDSEWAGTLEWIVAKQRNGPTGMVRLAFVGASTMVANLADDEQGNLGEWDSP
jgi:replicative DNA helicase